MAYGGYNGSFLVFNEEYDGFSWSTSNNMNVARSNLSGCGYQNAALGFGGYNAAWASYESSSEEYDGSSWIDSADMTFAKTGTDGSGTQASAFCCGGYNGAASVITEEYSPATTLDTAIGRVSVEITLI